MVERKKVKGRRSCLCWIVLAVVCFAGSGCALTGLVAPIPTPDRTQLVPSLKVDAKPLTVTVLKPEEKRTTLMKVSPMWTIFSFIPFPYAKYYDRSPDLAGWNVPYSTGTMAPEDNHTNASFDLCSQYLSDSGVNALAVVQK